MKTLTLTKSELDCVMSRLDGAPDALAECYADTEYCNRLEATGLEITEDEQKKICNDAFDVAVGLAEKFRGGSIDLDTLTELEMWLLIDSCEGNPLFGYAEDMKSWQIAQLEKAVQGVENKFAALGVRVLFPRS